jgi:hypothetical protein
VQDAALRLKHVHSLIELRDRIRRAVELCSPSRMKRLDVMGRCDAMMILILYVCLSISPSDLPIYLPIYLPTYLST